MEFTCIVTKDAGLNFGERGLVLFNNFLKENPGAKLIVTPVLPEGNKQRGYFEGCLVALVTYYQEGFDHHSSADRLKVRNWLKTEFNSEMIVVNGKALIVPKSTRGREALRNISEKTQEWLIDNYAPPVEALDPNEFKKWRDTIMPYGGPASYIDYLAELGVLPRR